MLKKILKWTAIVVLILAGLIVLFVGPWPTYGASDVEKEGYYKAAIHSIDESIAKSTLDGNPGKLKAGWGKGDITPPIGTPLAGYGARNGRPSTGVHDAVQAKALALNDGKDTVVLVGSDMLIVPDNVANMARDIVMKNSPLKPDNILFNSSHTHSGPGAWGPGFMAKSFAGTYDASIVELIAKGFASAILDAYNGMKSAQLAHGALVVPDCIRNRAHKDAPTDNDLKYMVAKQEDGSACYLVSYSAHPTVLGADNMEFSADYPGYLQRFIEIGTHQFAMYESMAVGSMGPKAEGPDAFTRARNLGEKLAKLVLDDAKNAAFVDRVELASVGFAFKSPSLQFRLNPSWRVSPYLLPMLGVNDIGWISAVRIGDMLHYGTPCDMSGEIANDMTQSAKQQGVDLWVHSFDGDYLGYVSPQKYYLTADPHGDEAYEMYLMSWMGPNQEPFFTHLMQHLVEVTTPKPVHTAAVAQ